MIGIDNGREYPKMNSVPDGIRTRTTLPDNSFQNYRVYLFRHGNFENSTMERVGGIEPPARKVGILSPYQATRFLLNAPNQSQALRKQRLIGGEPFSSAGNSTRALRIVPLGSFSIHTARFGEARSYMNPPTEKPITVATASISSTEWGAGSPALIAF